jgi:hypothetical protein
MAIDFSATLKRPVARGVCCWIKVGDADPPSRGHLSSAVVLTTKRAWSITESAYARGFDAPHRRPYQKLKLKPRDWLLLATASVVAAGIIALTRWPVW